MKCLRPFLVIVWLWLGFLPPAVDAASCRQQVVFAKGETAARVAGEIRGYGFCDYLVRAEQGQQLTIRSSSRKADTMLQGPMEQLLLDDDPVVLTASGVYTLRVLLPRALARKGKRDRYTLDIEIKTPPTP